MEIFIEGVIPASIFLAENSVLPAETPFSVLQNSQAGPCAPSQQREKTCSTDGTLEEKKSKLTRGAGISSDVEEVLRSKEERWRQKDNISGKKQQTEARKVEQKHEAIMEGIRVEHMEVEVRMNDADNQRLLVQFLLDESS